MRINIKKTKAVIFNKSGKIFRNEFKRGNLITDNYVPVLGNNFHAFWFFLTGPETIIQ